MTHEFREQMLQHADRAQKVLEKMEAMAAIDSKPSPAAKDANTLGCMLLGPLRAAVESGRLRMQTAVAVVERLLDVVESCIEERQREMVGSVAPAHAETALCEALAERSKAINVRRKRFESTDQMQSACALDYGALAETAAGMDKLRPASAAAVIGATFDVIEGLFDERLAELERSAAN